MADNADFNPAVLIPVYNHELLLPATLQRVLTTNLPVLLIDDGSDLHCQQVLQALAEKYKEQVTLLRLPVNRGKGAAVKAGLMQLQAAGYSHAVQIDADGQHQTDDITRFVARAKCHPEAFISGCPQYDDSVPKIRYYCRYLTHILVWLHTLSLSIKDSMCGFRVYPIHAVTPLLSACGNRMDFDSEIMVRWVWDAGTVINIPTRVHYPSDGVSHFRLAKDNLLMTAMHFRLFFGMLYRLPLLIGKKLRA